MKNYTIVILIIIIFVIILYIYRASKSKDGFTPGNSKTPGPGQAIGPRIAVDPGADSVMNLNKIVNAITTAFTPKASPASTIAKPDYQQLASDPTQQTVFSQDKCGPTQIFQDELPIDKQMKELIGKHQATMNDSLDKYIAKLDAIIAALNQPQLLMSLNPNIKSTGPSGLPIAKFTYDACGNSILNLTLVQGDTGDVGTEQGESGLPGIAIQGTVGGKGSVGSNPFQNTSFTELPKWYKGGIK
jgi:hypothetical protein